MSTGRKSFERGEAVECKFYGKWKRMKYRNSYDGIGEAWHIVENRTGFTLAVPSRRIRKRSK